MFVRRCLFLTCAVIGQSGVGVFLTCAVIGQSGGVCQEVFVSHLCCDWSVWRCLSGGVCFSPVL